MSKGLRVNGMIKVPTVQLIDEKGNKLGHMATYAAINTAKSAGMDLVEVSPNVTPPVCKIMDYGKYKYTQEKSAKKVRQTQLKEMQFSPNIADNDLNVKVNKIKEFIARGDKVKVCVVFSGREIVHTDVGRKILDRVYEAIQDLVKIESPPTFEGKFLRAQFAPK